MSDFQKIYEEIEKALSEKDSVREIAIKSSRAISRLASKIIWKIHRGEEVLEDLKAIKTEVWNLKSVLYNTHPDIYYAGYVLNALQEYCEACILYEIIANNRIPCPSELSVYPEAYLLGLADVVGEIRRIIVENLRDSKIEYAEHLFDYMERIYELLMMFSYPNAIVPLRPKQDVARGVVEKTRADIMLIKSQENLRKAMQTFE